MAPPRKIGRDPGLTARMTLTFSCSALFYVVLIGALFAAGASGILIALIAGGLLLLQFFTSDKLALRAMGAREVSPQEAPEFHAMIERLCLQADLPKPRVAVAQTAMPNAFALGRSPKNATVCATTGIMELLAPAELEGVMAHELTHVQNRDVIVMTIAAFFATVASYIVQFGFFFGGGGDDDDSAGFFALILVSLGRLRGLLLPAPGAVALPRVLRRPRGGNHHGPPERARLGAAEDLGEDGAHPPAGPPGLLRARRLLHLPAESEAALGNIFSTHPPLEKRLAALAGLESQLQGTSSGLVGAPRGPLRRPAGQAGAQEARVRSAVRHGHGVRPAREGARAEDHAARRRSSSSSSRPPTSRPWPRTCRSSSARRPRRRGTKVETKGGHLRLPLDDPARLRLRGPGDRHQRDQRRAGGGRLRRPHPGAVFPFEDESGKRVYWIYNYKRGAFYPFVPAGGEQQRDNERELRLKAQIGAELPLEPELERWFPLWDIPL